MAAAPDAPLLAVLRNDLGLNGPKYGCGLGECGACLVLLDGMPARACALTLANVAGRELTTLEGLCGEDGALHPVQQAFVDAQAAQCGYCSNGINYAIPWGGGGAENTWRIYRGKLYVFGGQKARDHFEMETELNLKRAHHHWNVEVAGSNALLTRTVRLVVRVPHYKSDAALQAEWEALRAAGKLPVMPGQPQVVPSAA